MNVYIFCQTEFTGLKTRSAAVLKEQGFFWRGSTEPSSHPVNFPPDQRFLEFSYDGKWWVAADETGIQFHRNKGFLLYPQACEGFGSGQDELWISEWLPGCGLLQCSLPDRFPCRGYCTGFQPFFLYPEHFFSSKQWSAIGKKCPPFSENLP